MKKVKAIKIIYNNAIRYRRTYKGPTNTGSASKIHVDILLFHDTQQPPVITITKYFFAPIALPTEFAIEEGCVFLRRFGNMDLYKCCQAFKSSTLCLLLDSLLADLHGLNIDLYPFLVKIQEETEQSLSLNVMAIEANSLSKYSDEQLIDIAKKAEEVRWEACKIIKQRNPKGDPYSK